mgnify:CR=1 FL=1
MNQQLKTILLTVLTISVFVIALVELSGVSKTALFNKYNIGDEHTHTHAKEADARGEKVAAMPQTVISFTDTKHDFGTITEGDVVRHAFHFKNTGDHPLLISSAVASCGCTVPEWPKEPIPPGGEGDIVVEFNSKKRTGHQQKNVMIHSNAQQAAMSIGFTADVKEK